MRTRFAARSEPAFKAGPYQVEATQSVVYAPDQTEDVNARAALPFHVQAPRFALAPGEVYSLYPPDGQSGAYQDTLAHVVLRNKNTPWLRGPAKTDTPAPWLGLLLFDADELALTSLAQRSYTGVLKDPPDEKVAAGGAIRCPDIALDPWEETPADAQAARCTTIDIPAELFASVAPSMTTLSLLAHVRHVETGDKEDVPGIGDGSFSVVICDRRILADARQTALLVSFEGHAALLENSMPTRAPVRLVVLAQWSFVSGGRNFEEMVGNLNGGNAAGNAWLRADPVQMSHPAVETALSLGHVPLPHALRHGDRTVSWYRGPFSPVPIPAQSQPRLYLSADEALQFDRDTGLFDVSYAAAWQLGRLLALQSPEFIQAMFRWRRDSFGDQAMADVKAAFAALHPAAEGISLDTQQAAEILRNGLLTSVILEMFSGSKAPPGAPA